MKNLKLLREERGLSQQKLAELFLISQQSIYKYENGLAEPSLDLLIKFSLFFDTSIDFIVGNSSERNANLFNDISPKETRHLSMYKKLSPNAQDQLDNLLETMLYSTIVKDATQ